MMGMLYYFYKISIVAEDYTRKYPLTVKCTAVDSLFGNHDKKTGEVVYTAAQF